LITKTVPLLWGLFKKPALEVIDVFLTDSDRVDQIVLDLVLESGARQVSQVFDPIPESVPYGFAVTISGSGGIAEGGEFIIDGAVLLGNPKQSLDEHRHIAGAVGTDMAMEVD